MPLSLFGRAMGLGPSRRAAVAVALAALSGCANGTMADAPSTAADVWSAAERWVPRGATNPPIVVLLHGCAGIGPGLRNWGRVLRDAGYLVIAPDSFARRDRAQWCDPRTHTTPPANRRKAQAIRAEEIAYALTRVREMAPPRAILMGHSEGGIATGLTTGGWDAYIVSGYSCRVLNIPAESPTLLLSYETDPWFVAAGGTNQCPAAAASRPRTRAYTATGHGHELGFDRTAHAAVLDFLRSLER
jgi:dienelactone hydrolase